MILFFIIKGLYSLNKYIKYLERNQKEASSYLKAMFNLTKKQFSLLNDFFNSSKSSNNLLSAGLIHSALTQTLKVSHKKKIIANESDFRRFVQLVDHDKDGYLTFEQLFVLLNLVTAQKNNLPSRVEEYFNSISNLETLIPEEAKECVNFLNMFYLPKPENLNEAHSNSIYKCFSLANTLIFGQNVQRISNLSVNLAEPVDKNVFAHQLSVYYQSSLYVI